MNAIIHCDGLTIHIRRNRFGSESGNNNNVSEGREKFFFIPHTHTHTQLFLHEYWFKEKFLYHQMELNKNGKFEGEIKYANLKKKFFLFLVFLGRKKVPHRTPRIHFYCCQNVTTFFIFEIIITLKREREGKREKVCLMSNISLWNKIVLFSTKKTSKHVI